MGVIAVVNIVLLAGIIVVVNGDENSSTPGNECRNKVDTHQYGYTKYYHVTDSGAQHTTNTFMLRFSVRAKSNAHILLSPTPDPQDMDPVYEVVLGAGQNTFSDIRRARRKGSRQTARTQDLLSATDFRTFWIAMSKDGILGVGNWGDDQPFLFWQDQDPLLIRYFSFSSWNGVWARWFFNCNKNNQTGDTVVVEEQVEEVTRPLATLEMLRRDLLTSYDPYVLPVVTSDSRTTVSMNLESQYVFLNEKRSILTFHGRLVMNWRDEKIQWLPDDYGNITSLNIIHNEIWKPEIILYNSASNGQPKLGFSGMVVTSEGGVTWRTTAAMETWCDLDLNEWPHDQHSCDIQLGVWSPPSQLVELKLVELEKRRTGSEWAVTESLAEMTWARTPLADLEPNSSGVQMPFTALTLRLKLQRSSKAYHSILRVPLIVISISSLISFWLSPLRAGKVTMLCFDMVVLVLFFLAVGSLMPAQADKVPRIVLVYCIGMMGVATAIFFSIFVIGLSRSAHTTAPPHTLYKLLCEKPASVLLCLPQTNSFYKGLEEQMADALETEKLQQYWSHFCTALDRLAFFTYTIFWAIVYFIYE